MYHVEQCNFDSWQFSLRIIHEEVHPQMYLARYPIGILGLTDLKESGHKSSCAVSQYIYRLKRWM
jgi:hypothetical protein